MIDNNQIAKRDNEQELNTMHYKPNEANFNYGGINININIPTLIENVKRFKKEKQERKMLKELQKNKENILDATDCEYVECDVEESKL